MTAEQLLSELRSLDIRLSVDGDSLRCNAPQGRITRELEQKIAAANPSCFEILSDFEPRSHAIPRYRGSRASLPLSFAQERLWFLQSFYPDSSAYNITAFRHIHAPVDLDALKWALFTICDRHEILRTNSRRSTGLRSRLFKSKCSQRSPSMISTTLMRPGREQLSESAFGIWPTTNSTSRVGRFSGWLCFV